MTRRVLRFLTVLALTLFPALVGVPARAADSVTVGLSGLEVARSGNATVLTGLLTMRSRSAVQLTSDHLHVEMDGVEHDVKVTQAPRKERRAMLVIDTSGSMGVSGMSTVRAAAAQFLKTVPADVMVGVTSFADTAGVDLAPTLDRSSVQRVVDGLSSRGNTSLYAAMAAATSSLGKTGDRSIVLLSDGADTVAPNSAVALADAVTRLRTGGVRVDVVRFKTEDPDAVTALTKFAGANGGAVVSAVDSAAVAAAFRGSAQAFDQQTQFTVSLPGVTAVGSHQVEVRGLAGGSTFEFSRAVNFPAVGAPIPAQVPATATPTPSQADAALHVIASPGQNNYVPWVAAALFALALVTGLVAASAPSLLTRREQRIAAIEDYVVSRSVVRAQSGVSQQSIADSLLNFGDKVMKDRTSTKTTLALIDRADLPFRAGEWLAVRVVGLVVGAVAGYFLLPDKPLVGVAIGAFLGLILPPVMLRFLAARRAKRFERQLPDVLMLIATSLKSGFGLPQALDAIARDAAEPAAKEFSRALAETRIGTDITEALEKMGDRMDSTSTRWTVMSIRIQRDVGGNLADTLKTTAATLRERESLHRQVMALSAEGRLSAYILMAMPIFLFIYMLRANYDYVSLLWTDPIGMIMSASAVGMLFAGAFWMRSVVKIEV